MTTDNFCFNLQNRLTQTSQTGGQRYSDTSPFSIPWVSGLHTQTDIEQRVRENDKKLRKYFLTNTPYTSVTFDRGE